MNAMYVRLGCNTSGLRLVTTAESHQMWGGGESKMSMTSSLDGAVFCQQPVLHLCGPIAAWGSEGNKVMRNGEWGFTLVCFA